MANAKPPSTRTVNRSPESGKFVTQQFAKTHKSTTETERVKVPSSTQPGKK